MPALALALVPTLDIKLKNHLASPSLELARVTRFASGGFRSTMLVRSGSFSADHPFFFEGAELAHFLDQLGRLERLEPGLARLGSTTSDDVLGLQLHARGDVTVSGALHESARASQVLRFAFTTDQTVLAPLRRELARCWSLPAF